MRFQKGHKLAKGGARIGSGPKPAVDKKAVEEAIKAATDGVSDRAQAAALAFQATHQMAHDPAVNAATRLAALIYIQNRVEGAPREPREHSGGITIKIEGYTPDLAG